MIELLSIRECNGKLLHPVACYQTTGHDKISMGRDIAFTLKWTLPDGTLGEEVHLNDQI